MNPADVDAWLGEQGRLAQQLPGYTPRVEQLEMARRVAKALTSGQQLMVEAGTGTGKTLAYLFPALASGHKVIVATATRHLQDQLYSKDVPLATRALDISPRIALLKGRSNYLCLHRLQLTEQGGGIRHPKNYAQVRTIRDWASRTKTGDINEIGAAVTSSWIWPRVTSTADNCLGKECPQFDDCWVVEARRRAQAADLVIANHHLLFADMALREEGFGEVLPGADAVILDEAHKLPEIAGRFFGKSISGRQLRDIARDGFAEVKEAGGDMPDLSSALDALIEAEEAFRHSTGNRQGNQSLEQALQDERLTGNLESMQTAVGDLGQILPSFSERSEGLSSLTERVTLATQRFEQLCKQDADNVSWLERRGSGWLLHITPLNIAPQFQRGVQTHDGAWVFTSATLSVDDSLDYFALRLGLESAEKVILDSPFNYKDNALLYLPDNLPEPRNNQAYDDAVVRTALPLIRASRGGAFLLCTSYRAVRRYAQQLASQGVSPLLVQGELGRGELLARFRDNPASVLVGTSSFWEGVDVQGQALRLVIIDRLPFAHPADPVLQARIRAMKEQGEQPFPNYQLPQAVITLKQGVGRLIRGSHDRGVLVICDPRLHSKGYGRTFLRSIPGMQVTHNQQDARQFLQQLAPK